MGSLWKRPGTLALYASTALLCLALTRPAQAQLQMTSADGSQSFKLGILGQVTSDTIDTPDGNHSEENIFLRRIRLLGGLKLGDSLNVFFDTDSPNLGKVAEGVKNQGNLFMQDFVVTYSASHAFQLDTGLILTPNSYNHLQSAASLLAVDYGAYTFNESTPVGSRTGRDYGVQARGYLAGDHVEYRVGVFSGDRGAEATNSLRAAGRVSVYFVGAETGLFYRGTSLGKTQTVEIGGSFDIQKQYHSYSGDFFWDQPVGGGNGFTLQGDYTQLDGKDFITALPKQKNLLLEGGYFLGPINLQPFVQYARETIEDPASATPSEHRIGFGLAYYFIGHTSNLKAQYNQIDTKGLPKHNEFLLQYQVFVF